MVCEKEVKEYLDREYPILIYPFKDGGTIQYFAFYPDFGQSACSAIADTKEEVLDIFPYLQ
jgi:predicted RNase H-like HicB family nuclease